MDEHLALAPLNLAEGAVTIPVELLPGQAARAEALNADDQLAALHESGHAVLATVAANPPFPVSGIDIKARNPHTSLAEGDDNMPRWHTTTRYRALLVVDLGGWAAEKILLGEPTTGGDNDLRMATTRALDLLAHGLERDAPFMAVGSFGGYGEVPVPPWQADEIAKATLRILERARDRALELAKEHGNAIRALASIVYRERTSQARRPTGSGPLGNLPETDRRRMLFSMGSVLIPRMTKPWRNVAVGMAGLGFIYGYVGFAGHDCVTFGSCLQDVADRGFGGLSPASVIPATIAAALSAGFLYVLYLLVYGVRHVLRPSHHGAQDTSPANGLPAADRARLPHPSPLVAAIGIALAWAILSVGPAQWADDLGRIAPADTASRPTCPLNSTPVGSQCQVGVDLSGLGGAPATRTDPICDVFVVGFHAVLEADGLCHVRSEGSLSPVMDDIIQGGQNGLLAFLAVGAALLLWARLRTTGQHPGGPS